MKKFYLFFSFLLLLTCAKEDIFEPDPIITPIPSAYNLTVSAGNGGTVSTSGGTFASGTLVTIQATLIKATCFNHGQTVLLTTLFLLLYLPIFL